LAEISIFRRHANLEEKKRKTTLKEQKTVFISGAAGGLGQSLVRIFSGRGFRIIATDKDMAILSLFNTLEDVISRKMEVTDPVMIRNISEELELPSLGLDILISAAGIYDTFPVTEAHAGLFKNMIDVNLLGTANLIQGLLGPLVKSQGRAIVVTSESYKVQVLFQPYMISKAALESYCKSARQELALKKVKLLIVRPGAIQTPLLKWMNGDSDEERFPVYSEEYRKSYEMTVKMVGRITDAKVVAELIYKAATNPHPRRIYRVNNSLLVKIISVIPLRLLDWIVVKRFSNR
jgi:NAD(P)-dependent dehydrogenase (short-subunit alcohol dehydrogenase family)